MKTKNKLWYSCAIFLLAFMLSCEREQVAIENDTVIEEEQYNELNELTVSSSATYEGKSLYNSHHHAVYDESLNRIGKNPYHRSLYKYADNGDDYRIGPVIATFHAGPKFDSNSFEVRARDTGSYSDYAQYYTKTINLEKIIPINASSWNFSKRIRSFTLAGHCKCTFKNGDNSLVFMNYASGRARYITSTTQTYRNKSLDNVGWRPKTVHVQCNSNFEDKFVGYAHNEQNYFKASIPLYLDNTLNFTDDRYSNWRNTIESITMEKTSGSGYYLRVNDSNNYADIRESYTNISCLTWTCRNFMNKIDRIQVLRSQ